MGWAKYLEDNVSRWVNDNHGRQGTDIPPARKVKAAQTGELHQKKEKEMSRLKEFTMSSARPLPVIVLADVSGSMGTNGKIDALNDAVAEMVATFADEDDSQAEIHVSVVTFGRNGASVHQPLRPARETTWEPMAASGRTPMGEAFSLARQMVEDRSAIPSRAYRPTIVLVSDGIPTDDWRGPLEDLLMSDRASKAARFALAIGADADRETLAAFLANDQGRVFEAHEAREIKNFFRWVTMSVTTRTRSATPDSVVMIDPTDLGGLDF